MGENSFSRRQVLQAGGLVALTSSSGCLRFVTGGGSGAGGDSSTDTPPAQNTLQDSDGDGVVNTEDYAPWDEDVQEKSQLVGSSPTGQPSPTSTEAPTTDASQSELLSVPFTEEFTDGLNGWEVGLRYRTGENREPDDPPAGEGGYSEKYEGSVRLRVEGGPSTIGVGRRLAGLPAGTTVSVTYHVEASSPQPGKVGAPVFAPDGDDMADTWAARNEGSVEAGEHTITGTVSDEFPAKTQLRVTADVWPGAFTAYVTRIHAE